LLRDHADAVEADLSRFHGIDYRDRWRAHPDGGRRLSLRMIFVRVRHLPHDAATVLAIGGHGWSLTDFLLADLFHASANAPHPDRPTASAVKAYDPEREKRVRAAKRRAVERARAIEAGDIT